MFNLSYHFSSQNHADYLITVPEVVKEIKNKRQLKRLCVLPYDLVVDEPSASAVQHVIAFAKKTGDYLSLSSADIKVIALTYQLECELVGKDHLRNEPIVAKTIASKRKPVEMVDKTPLAGFYVPPEKEAVEEKTRQNRELIAEKIEQEEKEAKDNNDDDNIEFDDEPTENASQSVAKRVEQLEEQFTKLNCDLVSETEANEILVSVKDNTEAGGTENSNESDSDSVEEDSDDDDDDESSWITPSNINEMKSACGKDVLEETDQARVACMSTDFAVQNVLKQINLNIAALDGRLIKQMRTYILRCYACFKTTSIMTKLFCPNCGHKTLKRVAVSMDENGQQVIHINLRRPLTAKGKNQSIPRPRGGKHSSNPILFEDQPIPKQFPSRVARTKTNAMEEDYIAGKYLAYRQIHTNLKLINLFNTINLRCIFFTFQDFHRSFYVMWIQNRLCCVPKTVETSNNGPEIMHTEI